MSARDVAAPNSGILCFSNLVSMRYADVVNEIRPNTAFLLMAQYNGAAVIPLESVCRDYFRHLTIEKLLRKILSGEIALPVVRIEKSQKAARGVHLGDLADYLDRQRAAALKECTQLSGTH